MYENITCFIDVFENWKSEDDRSLAISEFLKNLEKFADHNYAETLRRYGYEWSARSMSSADLRNAPAELVLALLTAAYRADHFSNGILENEFIPNGLVLRCLKRLEKFDSPKG